MRTLRIIALTMMVAGAVAAQAQEKSSILRLDPALDDIVSPDAKVELVVGGYQGLEGPVWVRKGGYLLFADMDANAIYKWNAADGKTSTFLDKPAQVTWKEGQDEITSANGITVDPQGRIVYCSRGDRAVIRLEADGRRTVLASHYNGKPLNSPNDLIYRSDGALYFTDPSRLRTADTKDGHVFLLKDGKLQLVFASDPKLAVRPNGIALSPDEKILYIADNSVPFNRRITRFDVKADGTIANGRVLIDMSAAKGSGAPDGMKVDQKGNLYARGPAEEGSALWIVSPAGKHLGTIVAPGGFTNVAFGDADGMTLYSVGGSSVYRIRLKIPGVRP